MTQAERVTTSHEHPTHHYYIHTHYHFQSYQSQHILNKQSVKKHTNKHVPIDWPHNRLLCLPCHPPKPAPRPTSRPPPNGNPAPWESPHQARRHRATSRRKSKARKGFAEEAGTPSRWQMWDGETADADARLAWLGGLPRQLATQSLLLPPLVAMIVVPSLCW